MHHRCNSFIRKCCSLGVIQDSLFMRVCAPPVLFSKCCGGGTCDILCSVGKLVFARLNASKAKGLNRRSYVELYERAPFAVLLGTVCAARARMQDMAPLASTGVYKCACVQMRGPTCARDCMRVNM